tara:strand:+ start:138 stop:521 length:384 start_codon:yes stop_codon:yes gene_type:complete
MNINLGILIKIFLLLFFSFSIYGETIEKNYALFKLLNKTTNKVSQKKISVNQNIDWETLNIEVLYCASTIPTEIPEDYVLVDVYDNINKEKINIYRGWMISSLPSVTPLENPIYDLWLLDCINDNDS